MSEPLDPGLGELPDWLRGRFHPLPDVADWDQLTVGLDIEAHFHSAVALASELLAAADPWADVDLPPSRLSDEQRRGLA